MVGPSLANIILEIGLIVIFNITLQLQEIQINLFLVLQVPPKFVICLTNLRNQHVSFLTTSVFTTAYTNVWDVRNGGCKACNHKPPGQTDFNKPQAKHQGQAHVASNIATNSGPSPSCEHGPGFRPSDQVSPSQDLTNVLSSMQNSLQSLSVHMEKLERPPAPIPLVAPPPPELPQTPGLPLALTFHRKFQLMVVQLSQQFPTTFRFRHWTLQINTFCGPLFHLQGSPFPSPLIVAAVCHWSVRLMLMSLLKNIPT